VSSASNSVSVSTQTRNVVFFPFRLFIFVKASLGKEASTEASRGIGSQILSRLRNVRMSAREEEYEGCSRHCREIEGSPWVEVLGS